MANTGNRLTKLEKALNPAPVVCRQSQVVIYNPVTGEPLNAPDPNAARQVWLPDNGRGLDLANVR
jgi:hypothetical protein